MELLTSLLIPIIICLCALLLLLSKKDLADSFFTGAQSGIKTTVGLLPGLVLMCSAASMFTASGAGEILSKLLSPLTTLLGIPGEILPFLIVRPISGSASNSVLVDLFSRVGSDSLAGFTASVIAGSSDTMLYIFAVYFSAVGVKNTRFAIPIGFISMLAVIILSTIIARAFI